MAEIETLGILEEIEALVSDKLQVVSYKWLSRNFLLPSDSSKRLLHKFVEKHGDAMEVVYTLSGWLKNNPSVYHIRLVSGPKLAESKQDFDGSCSVHVYSVQACIPKDPAALWNAEYVQAEELFSQPPATDNCLRDNRLCRILNSFVKRNTEGTAASIAVPQPKTAGMAGPSKSNLSNQNSSIPQPPQKKVQQSSPKVGLQPTHAVKDIKTENPVAEGHKQVTKCSSDKEKVPQLPANKKKGQNERSTSGNGSSLANMWDRATTKPRPSTATTKTPIIIPDPTVSSAEAQICAHEAVEAADSDGDGEDFNFKRASNGEGSRKRRVVFDFSDEDDEFKDAVSLASPDPPKRKSFLDKQSSESSVPEKNNFDIDKEKENKLVKAKEDSIAEKAINQPPRADSSLVNKGKTAEISCLEKVHSPIPENNAKDKLPNAAPTSPKRRKIMKTRIDERGREVTEVVWEGEETETETKGEGAETKADGHAVTKTENSSANNTANRAPAAKKSTALGNTAPSNPGGKAGNKKAGKVKDPKQGNIMSFFKKDNDILESFKASDQASTLEFAKQINIEGTVFQRFPPDLLRKLSTDCLVMQNHQYGISPEKFRKYTDLCNFFKILTTSSDSENKVYVSTVQAHNYPVTAFQWHPEKNAFEWGLSMIPHSEDAVQVTQYVANFFVSEARKSLNRPPTRKVLNNLIYNYSPTYCGKAGKGYDEVYIFDGQNRSSL